MSEAAIDLYDVWVRLGREQVLEAVELVVPRGDYLALIGPNGGGKTTLLRVILGLVRPHRGNVRILGHEPEEVRGRVAYVPQYTHFDMDFPIRVIDVVRMGRLGATPLLRRSRETDGRRALETLEQLQIADLAERRVGSLSGGQLQRVLIARALAVEPELLLLDEPTASLDVQSADAFYDLVGTLAQRMTVVLSTHDITGVSARVGTIACLNRRLFFHPSGDLTPAMIAQAYGCPIELLGHGVPHRVLGEHADKEGGG